MQSRSVKFSKVEPDELESSPHTNRETKNPLQHMGDSLGREGSATVDEATFEVLEIDSPESDAVSTHTSGHRIETFNHLSVLPPWLAKFIEHSKPVELLAVAVVFVIILIAIIVAATAPRGGGSSTSISEAVDSTTYHSFLVNSTAGVVAADSGTCSNIGVGILKKGGNAVDATIATTLCLGVVSPISSGIGGGSFIVVHNSTTKENVFIDSREVAPSGATATMFTENPQLAQHGGLAIAVPAELKGLHYIWTHYGSGAVTWKQLVLPAADLSRRWVISPQLSALMEKYNKEQLQSGDYPALSALFLRRDGDLKQVGDVVEDAVLADTLERIADEGPNYLYETMAETLAQEIRDAGGIMTADDIQSYSINVYPALESLFMGGYTYIGAQGSSSGGPVVAGILHFMQAIPTPLASLGSVYYHWLAEAMKHAFAIRLHLADPDYVNTTGPVAALLNDAYMAHLQQSSSPDAVLGDLSAYGGTYNLQYLPQTDAGTTHVSVVDSWGNAVALTSTVNTHFGSKVRSPSTGVLFNNEMDDFSIPNAPNFFGLAPSPFNYPAPGKRPLSSMSPSIVLNPDGSVRLVGGASGGPRIITATVQVILNVLGRGMDLLSALVLPRIHSQLLPDRVYVEDQQTVHPQLRVTASNSVFSALESRGHVNVTAHDGSMGVAQFVSVDPDSKLLEAVSDPRKDGRPAGV